MEDIVERLRDRAYCTYRKDALCEEAADLIEQMGGARDPGDIVAAARAHIASLPTHLKDRYSAKLICKLIAKVLLLEELREQDGAVISLQLREYQKMKDRCVNGDQSYVKRDDASGVSNTISLTDAEREAIKWCIEQWAGINRSTTLRNLLERTKCPS